MSPYYLSKAYITNNILEIPLFHVRETLNVFYQHS
jgi:hypothetical protein